jgi:hypothetical protein
MALPNFNKNNTLKLDAAGLQNGDSQKVTYTNNFLSDASVPIIGFANSVSLFYIPG